MLNTFFNLVVCLIEGMFYRGIHMLILSIYEVSLNITHTSVFPSHFLLYYLLLCKGNYKKWQVFITILKQVFIG